MALPDLDARLAAAASELDASTPAFDVARLGAVQRRSRSRVVALMCALALAAAVAAPSAVSALRGLFEVEEVAALDALEPGVAAPLAGRNVSPDALDALAPFPASTITSLGAPAEVQVRDDIAGGMITVGYRSGLRLTQWLTDDVAVRIAFVPQVGTAEDVAVALLPGLWVEGAARGTFTLVGADGAVHRESFAVRSGALLWRQGPMTFLLRGVADRDMALRLASEVGS